MHSVSKNVHILSHFSYLMIIMVFMLNLKELGIMFYYVWRYTVYIFFIYKIYYFYWSKILFSFNIALTYILNLSFNISPISFKLNFIWQQKTKYLTKLKDFIRSFPPPSPLINICKRISELSEQFSSIFMFPENKTNWQQ